MLVIVTNKNSGWVPDGDSSEEFSEDFQEY
jgi:hypothetical protein